MLVHVYRNLTKKCWSVRHKGKVIEHRDFVTLENPQFVVQPAGRARVIKEKRKNVHAYIKGKILDITLHVTPRMLSHGEALPVRYNPYLAPNFFYYNEFQMELEEYDEPMKTHKYAYLTEKGAFVSQERTDDMEYRK